MIELLIVWVACVAAAMVPELTRKDKDLVRGGSRAYYACIGAWLMWVAM